MESTLPRHVIRALRLVAGSRQRHLHDRRIAAHLSTSPANGFQISQAPTAVAEFFVPVATMDLGEIDLPLGYTSGTNAVTVSIQSGASQPTTLLESSPARRRQPLASSTSCP